MNKGNETFYFSMKARALEALRLHVAKKDIRVYLKHFHFRVQHDNVVITATDGHSLLRYRLMYNTGVGLTNSYEFTIDSKLIPKLTKKDYDDVIQFSFIVDESNNAIPISVAHGNSETFVNEEKRYNYPDSRVIANDIKTVHEGTSTHFNWTLLKRVADTRRIIHPKTKTSFIPVTITGNDGACIADLSNNNFFCVVMPLRDDIRPTFSVPEWAK